MFRHRWIQHVLAVLAVLLASAAAAQSMGWVQLPGAAFDIGVGGPNNTAWAIGTNAEGGGYGIYRWNGANWDKIPGSAVRIDVDPKGNAWVVTSGHAIFRFDGQQFVNVPGAANDIGIGADGSVWIIGNNKVGPSDFDIYRYVNGQWQLKPGGAVRIDVDPRGNPWVVNSGHQIFHWNGASWDMVPGGAIDVGVGADGTVFIVGTDQGVYKWTGAAWSRVEGSLTNVSVDNKGRPWGVNGARNIYASNGAPPPPGKARGSYITTGATLGVNDYLVSENKNFFAVQQADGNLCVYHGDSPAHQFSSALWCHQHVAPGGVFTTAVQGDGNLCTYPGATAAGRAIWCSNAVATSKQFFVVMQDDANLCVFAGPDPKNDWGVLWCENTNVLPHPDVPDPPLPMLVAGQGPDAAGGWICAYNSTRFSAWVTVYGSAFPFPKTIKGSGCVKRGTIQCFPVMSLDHFDYKIRGEVTRTADCSPMPNNSHVLCDIDSGFPNYNGAYDVGYGKLWANALKCGWDTRIRSSRGDNR
jgi:hypothetical protein